MDSWTPDQIKLMRIAGNDKCNNFLAQHNALAKQGGATNINTKYNSPAACLYKDRLEAEIAGRPLPTQLPAAQSSGGSGGVSGSVEPINGESEEAYVRRQQRQREEAQERLRQKFGKTTGLGGGSAMQGIGSDASYRPGQGDDSEGFNLSLDSLGFSEQSAAKLKSDAAKAAADTWSFLGSSASWLGETVSSAASNVVETVDQNNRSKNNRGNSGNGSSQEEDDTWSTLKSSAWGFYEKAAQAGSEVAKSISEIQGGDDDDGPLFPTKNLKSFSTGKMSHSQGGGARGDSSGDIFDFRRDLQTSSTGKMTGIGSDSMQAPDHGGSIKRSSGPSPRSGNDSETAGGSASRGMQRTDSGSSGDREKSSQASTPLFGASRASSTNSLDSQLNKEKAPGSQGSQGTSPRAPKEGTAKKLSPPPADDDFFGSFGVTK